MRNRRLGKLLYYTFATAVSLLVGATAYMAVGHFFGNDIVMEKESGEVAYGISGREPGEEQSAYTSLTPISLIYSCDAATYDISRMFIEVFDSKSCSLSYYLLPIETRYTMSKELYQELGSANTNLPQIVTLKELYHYYNRETAFDAGRRIVGELYGITIEYYTVIDDEMFGTFFESAGNRETLTFDLLDNVMENVEYYACKTENVDVRNYREPEVNREEDAGEQGIEGLDIQKQSTEGQNDEEQNSGEQGAADMQAGVQPGELPWTAIVKKWMVYLCNNYLSNMKILDRLPYLEALSEVEPDGIRTFVLPGSYGNSGFTPDATMGKKRLYEGMYAGGTEQ